MNKSNKNSRSRRAYKSRSVPICTGPCILQGSYKRPCAYSKFLQTSEVAGWKVEIEQNGCHILFCHEILPICRKYLKISPSPTAIVNLMSYLESLLWINHHRPQKRMTLRSCAVTLRSCSKHVTDFKWFPNISWGSSLYANEAPFIAVFRRNQAINRCQTRSKCK